MQKYGTTNIKQSKRTKTPTYCLARKQKNIRVYIELNNYCTYVHFKICWITACLSSLHKSYRLFIHLFLASFPGLLCAGGEKRAWYTLFAHAQFPQDFWNLEISINLLHYTKVSARHVLYKDACHWQHSVWMMKEQRRHSPSSLQKLYMHLSIPAKLNAVACDWHNLLLWSAWITSNKAMQTIIIKEFLTSKSPICVSHGV